MARHHWLLALGLIFVLATAIGPAAPSARADDDHGHEHDHPTVLLVMDVSGSMADPVDSSGGSKMDAAKAALITSLDSLPQSSQVGLRVYGADNDGFGAAGACEDSSLVYPVSELNKEAMATVINRFTPRGDTPIAYSLRQGMADISNTGHIVLVSDGEETCDPDPCATISSLVDSTSSGVQIDVIGFGVQETARAQLSCIAEAGGGTYYDAADTASLTASLEALNSRAAEPFTVSGTDVRGASEASAAPVLSAGQYKDVSQPSISGKVTSYYAVQRQWANSTLRVNATARMPVTGVTESVQRALWNYTLSTPDGQVCSTATEDSPDTGSLGVVVSRTIVALGLDPRNNSPDETVKACAEADQLIFALQRGEGVGDPDPVEIHVIEEPPAENDADLPAGVDSLPGSGLTIASPASGTPTEVTGGASFNNALELESGTYITELVPGELVFFKTPIDYGQSAVFALDGLEVTEETMHHAGSSADVVVSSDVYAPDFSKTNSEEHKDYATYEVTKDGVVAQDPLINQVPEVRYRNRWDSPPMYMRQSSGFSMGGYYYYAIGLGSSPILEGHPAQVRFSFAVTGEPGGAPVADQPVSAGQNPGTVTEQGAADHPWWLPYVIGAVALLLGVLLLFVIHRANARRSVKPRRGVPR